MAATILIQICWQQTQTPPTNRDNASRSEVDLPISGEYLATLTQTLDCEWENVKDHRGAGSRLLPGELRLRKGIARIRFDSGADLVIEGPVALRLDSGTSALVRRGKVVFQSDESAAPFDLTTPSATFNDLGTEYAVAVGLESEEIHVFDGEVLRTSRSAPERTEPEHLKAGEAPL